MFIASLLLATRVIAGAQANPAPPGQDASTQETAKPLVLTGCVTADRTEPDKFTLRESSGGPTYRLYGVKMYAYAGRRVRIVGGLYPSANIAVQAGAIDPTKAAMAASEAATAGIAPALAPPPEIRVSQVRRLKGPCPPAP